jgi:para-aminobenzoate synthetase component I
VLRCAADGTWWHESLSGAALSDWVAEALRELASPRRAVIAWGEADRSAHQRGVRDCLEAIAAGEVYQACVCTQFTGTLDGAPVDFFVDAVTRTAPARAAFLAGAWGAVASLSPELFLRRCGPAVTSSPIKGTLPLSADPSALRASTKDVAENIMIVDLVRNDLGRVCRTGSVGVPELLAVEEHPGLVHLVSRVAGRLRADAGWPELLAATFPPGSVTGAPKLAALDIIGSVEDGPRGPYCGAFGWIDADRGRAELAVAIRTFWREQGPNGPVLSFGTGAGITWGSDPAAEWRETELKSARLLRVACDQEVP